MDGQVIDFEGAGVQGQNVTPANNSSGENVNNSTQEDVTPLNGGETDDVTGKDGNANKQATNNEDNNPSTGELAIGDSIEVDGVVYTVAENGNLVNDKGEVFKEAKDVAEWLKSVEVEEASDNSSLDLASIQEAIGITITDDKGNAVEFTNDSNGVKSYIESVIDLKSNELQQAAINRLYQDNPLLKQFQDYVQLTGSPRGFGEIPDRSGIRLDKNNDAQLIAVIKMAAQEFGNKSLNDNYIKYLKDSGGLYAEATAQLEALVEKDNAYRKEIETRAQQQREEEAKSVAEYWKTVNNLINNRIISGYKIPESFTREVNGKKVVVTPDDFFAFVSAPSVTLENGQKVTGYQAALNDLSDEDYLNREMLDAWLMFTGGTYKDLIDMAVKEEKVRQLRVKSKEHRSTKAVKIVKNSANKSDINDVVFN